MRCPVAPCVLRIAAGLAAGVTAALLVAPAATAAPLGPDDIEGTYTLQVTPVDPNLPTCSGTGGEAEMEISSATPPGAAAGSFEVLWTYGGDSLALTGTWNADDTFQIPVITPAWDPVDPMATMTGAFTATGDTVQVQGRTDPDPMVPEWMSPCPVTWTGEKSSFGTAGGSEPGAGWTGRIPEGLTILAAILVGGLLLKKLAGSGARPPGGSAGGPPAVPAPPPGPPIPPLPPGLPPTDAWGRPWIVQNGTYAGGALGQVWFGGQWVDPAEAVERAQAEARAEGAEAARRAAWQRETQEKAESWMRSRARGEETPREQSERREREKLEQELKESQARVEAAKREYRESLATGVRASEGRAKKETARAETMGTLATVAEWTQWGAERGIDVLATVTGPAGASVKWHYQWVKNVAAGAAAAAATQDPKELLKGVQGAGQDLLWEAYGGSLYTKMMKGPMPSVIPAGQRIPSSWARVPIPWPGGPASPLPYALTHSPQHQAVAVNAVTAAARGYGWDATVGDGLKNVSEGKWPYSEGRDPLTRAAINRAQAAIGSPSGG